MRTVQSLRDRITDKEGCAIPVLALAFHPSGKTLFAATGPQVLLYDTVEGTLKQALKGHKDTVYCLDVAKDGKRLVSGGKDKTIIIWNESFEPILRYSHAESVQALAINQVSGAVCSGTLNDFGLWSAEQKNVTKYKVASKVTTCAWTRDGQYFALGHLDGKVSIRDRNGEEKVCVNRGLDAPIWRVCWNPSLGQHTDILAVADWSQRLSFYQANGAQAGREKQLDYDPCTVTYFHHGEYLVIGGSDNKLTMWTSDGICIGIVGECDSWIWTSAVHPHQNMVAFGSEDGSVCMQQVVFNTVHALYHDRYAYRDNMTDVLVQHLTLNQRVRIKCRDYVKKVALYKDKLAVQLPERIVIYQFQATTDTGELYFQIKEKIQKKVDSNLLVVTSHHILLCVEQTLRLYNFKGEPEREWGLDSQIRYIKVTGGPVRREGILVGTRDGRVIQIFVDNPFPVEMVKQTSPIRCVDVSRDRSRLAVIDDSNVVSVYDTRTNGLLYQEPDASSVAWNTDHDDMLCFSGNGVLSIKAGNLPAHQQKQQGYVVGFTGSKIFVLHMYSMTIIDVPHSASVQRFLERKEYARAYQVACLGVTEADWQRFADKSLIGLQLEFARKAFVRLCDVRGLDFVHVLIKMTEREHLQQDELLGEIYAFLGRFTDAATQYKKAGNPQKAIDLYTELNMWEYATRIALETNTNVNEVLKRKAQMQQDKNDLRSAAETYIQVGDHMHAVELLGQIGSLDRVIEMVRTLPKTDTQMLRQCVSVFRKHNHVEYIAETLRKLDDTKSLLHLLVEQQAWKEAFELCKQDPEQLKPIVFVPYANWLVTQDRFVEAQEYYQRGGSAEQSYRVIEQLIYNAVAEERFHDAGYLYWMFARQSLQTISPGTVTKQLSSNELQLLRQHYRCAKYAELYYAYHHIHRYMEEPFTSQPLQHLFNMARFILQYASSGKGKALPSGISRVYVMYALAKTARSLRAYSVASWAFEQLQRTCRGPPEWANPIDIGTLLVRGKLAKERRRLRDEGHGEVDVDEQLSELLMPICFACSTTNPLLNSAGGLCVQCGERFVCSLYSFEYLPLVEFALEPSITDEEALRILGSQARTHTNKIRGKNESKSNRKDDEDNDPFLVHLSSVNYLSGTTRTASQHATSAVDNEDHQPTPVDRYLLSQLDRNEVLIRRSQHACVSNRYFKLILTEVSLTMCENCQGFFHSDDFEEAAIQNGECPFCRTVASANVR